MLRNRIAVWLAGLFLLFIFRLIFSGIFNAATPVALLGFIIFMNWSIVPFFLGDDMEAPGSSHVLIAGQDDFWRLIHFGVGIFGYMGCVFVKS
jgi:hypothetical protein